MTALATLDGARVLVTGASSGIGAALAPMLAERGAIVGLVARRAERLEAVAEECRRHGGDHRIWAIDLSDPARAADLAVEAWDALEHLDAVVNNAAQPMRRAIENLDLATVEGVMQTNFFSPVAIGLAVLPLMQARGCGVIVNVSSLGGRLGIPHEAAYCASKFALSGWSESMAMDLWDSPVEIRLVTPGAIDTEIWDQPGNETPAYDGPLEPPTTVALAICDALVGEHFETYVPDMKAVAEFKAGDIDTYLAGAAAMTAASRDDPPDTGGDPA